MRTAPAVGAAAAATTTTKGATVNEPPGRVTTTNDPAGGGRPRLIVGEGGRRSDEGDGAGRDQQEFELLPGVTTIGSSPDADIRLAGLCPQHAEVRRNRTDEYAYVHLDPAGHSTVDGANVGEKLLHSGDRIELGDWMLSFARAEFADHGRPYGGRQGGEFSDQRQQDTPRARGTSAGGGSAAAGDDPGEYF